MTVSLVNIHHHTVTIFSLSNFQIHKTPLWTIVTRLYEKNFKIQPRLDMWEQWKGRQHMPLLKHDGNTWKLFQMAKCPPSTNQLSIRKSHCKLSLAWLSGSHRMPKGQAVNPSWWTWLWGRAHPCVTLGFALLSRWHYSAAPVPSSLITEILHFPVFWGLGEGRGFLFREVHLPTGPHQNWSYFSGSEETLMNLFWVRVSASCAYSDFCQRTFLKVLTASWFPLL